jgi:hypothetical protein
MKEVWAIRARLELRRDVRELALFDMAIASKLRGCDLVRLKVGDVAAGGEIKSRAIIVQKKTGTPVQFEITEQARRAADELIRRDQVGAADYLFRSRLSMSAHLSTRQYARFNCCPAIRSSRVPSAISASKWMTRGPFPRGSIFNLSGRRQLLLEHKQCRRRIARGTATSAAWIRQPQIP